MSTMNSQTTDSNEVDLQARLEDRERLVEELTNRLEQAAEQLDRLQRSGAGRGGRSAGGGVPPELLDQQKSLTEELRQAVQNWEDMQPTVLLSRLEMQLGELRDMMQGGLQFSAHPMNGQPAAGAPSAGSAPPEKDEPSPSTAPEGDLSELSIYEQFKRGLDLSDAPAPPPKPQFAESQPAEEPASAAAGESESEVEPPPPPLAQIPSVEPPEPVDFETADEQALRDAVDQRDSFIVYLLKRLRTHETVARPNGDWRALEDKPGELAVRLEEYEKQLEEMLRLAEVETSLERARLGREAADLEVQRHQIQSVMAHLETQAEAEAEAEDEDDGEEPQTGESKKRSSRLRRFLGRRKSDDG